MSFRKHTTAGFLLATLAAGSLSASAAIPLIGKKKKTGDDLLPSRKPTAAQNALIDKSIVREKAVIKAVKERAPMVETYIQNMRPDPVLIQVPDSDQHFLGRVAFGKVINDATYQTNNDTAHGTSSGGKLELPEALRFLRDWTREQFAPELPRSRFRADVADGLELL